MSTKTPYWELEQLTEIYLEDSYVLSIEEKPDELLLEMDFVLREQHPRYRAPRTGEQYCYHRGSLAFRGVHQTTWITRRDSTSHDASGSADLGNIDSLVCHGNTYELEGDWGHVVVVAAGVEVLLE